METELLWKESVKVRQGIVGGGGEGRWEGVVREDGRAWREGGRDIQWESALICVTLSLAI